MLPACPLAGERLDSDESVTYETGGRSYRAKKGHEGFGGSEPMGRSPCSQFFFAGWPAHVMIYRTVQLVAIL